MHRMKTALRDELVRVLREALAAAESAHAATVEGAFHSEAKAESDKDTRAVEQSYVARGQAMRVEELRTGVAEVERMSLAPSEKIKAGSLVVAEDADGGEKRYFVAPAGGGTALGGGTVQVVTPKSPLGRALCGKEVDDEVELGARALTITKID